MMVMHLHLMSRSRFSSKFTDNAHQPPQTRSQWNQMENLISRCIPFQPLVFTKGRWNTSTTYFAFVIWNILYLFLRFEKSRKQILFINKQDLQIWNINKIALKTKENKIKLKILYKVFISSNKESNNCPRYAE